MQLWFLSHICSNDLIGNFWNMVCTHMFLELRRPRPDSPLIVFFSHVLTSTYAMLAGLLFKTLYVELAHHYMLSQLRTVVFVTSGYVVNM